MHVPEGFRERAYMAADKEILALRILTDNVRGLYGSELIHLSDGGLARGTTYVILGRLVDKGLVKTIEDPPTTTLKVKRTRYVITGAGARACREWADDRRVKLQEGAFGRGVS